MTEFSTVTVTPKAETLLRGGHVWVYADEITAGPDAEVEDGSLVCIRSAKGKFLGTGFFNSHSKIRMIVLTAPSGNAGFAGQSTIGIRLWASRIFPVAV